MIGQAKHRGLPSAKDPARLLETVREILNVWKGDVGDRLDRVVTLRDLVEPGLLDVRQSSGGTVISIAPGEAVAGSNTVPNAITGLTANGTFGAVILQWDDIADSNVAYVSVLRNGTDSPATAVEIGTAIASKWVDNNVTTGQTYYYWVRAVSTAGVAGPVNATAGTLATATAISYADFGSELSPIRIVSSLPGSGNKEGDHVFLTTDQKLYKYTGGAWEEAVSNAQLSVAPTWENTVSVSTSAANSSITKSGGTGSWDAGATSVETCTTGDCAAQFKVGSASTSRFAIGLNASHTGASYTDIDFALTNDSGTVYKVYQNGSLAYTSGVAVTQGDACVVRVRNGSVEYVVNGTIIYTSGVSPTYPLFIDTSFYTNGAQLTDVYFFRAELLPGKVTADSLAPGSINASHIIANQIQAGHINAGAVTADKIYAGSVTTEKIAVGAITAASAILANASVVDANIASLSAAKITAGTISATFTYTGSQVISTNGHLRGGQTSYNTGTGFWLGYHGGTYKLSLGNPSGNYLTWDGSTLFVQGDIYGSDYVSGSLVLLTFSKSTTITLANKDSTKGFWKTGPSFVFSRFASSPTLRVTATCDSAGHCGTTNMTRLVQWKIVRVSDEYIIASGTPINFTNSCTTVVTTTTPSFRWSPADTYRLDLLVDHGAQCSINAAGEYVTAAVQIDIEVSNLYLTRVL